MTSTSRLHRIAAPLAAAAATAAVFTAALWVQHAREAWPFLPRAHAVAVDAVEPVSGAVASTAGSAFTHDRAPVDAAAVASLDIRLETVGRSSMTQIVRAVATVVPDESRISHVHTRVAGWIEQLDVNTTGEMVRAGQPLARVFSQELLSSQTEYLAARKNTAASGIASAVVASGRTRLTVLGMTPADIDGIEQTGEPTRLVTVVAPRVGVVVNRGVTVGTSVDPSTTLLTIADLSRVWVLAEVSEASIPSVRVGTRAQLDFPASGRAPFAARVDFVYPVLTERTRTLRVRLAVANPGGAVKPGLYGTAIFESAGRQTITVPRDAVVDTGLQQHVFVANGDHFEPRDVRLGAQVADRVEIRAGLREGEQIVAAGVFLLDSESRLRATGGAGGHNHGAPTTREQSSSLPAKDPHAGHQTPSADPHTGHRE
jgi:membrane fusion protein, copper/silver efflux system